jgi:hypothetical protein
MDVAYRRQYSTTVVDAYVGPPLAALKPRRRGGAG